MGSVAEKADVLPIRLAIGLMSGTSLDGIDAALIETDGEHHVRPIAFRPKPYSEQARRQLQEATALALSYERPRQSPEIVAATEMLTRRHLLVIRQLLATAGVAIEAIDVVGFHGQTVAHRPDRGWTWQIGDGDAMAAALGRAGGGGSSPGRCRGGRAGGAAAARLSPRAAGRDAVAGGGAQSGRGRQHHLCRRRRRDGRVRHRAPRAA